MAQLPGWIPRKKIMIKDTHVNSDLVDFPLYVKIANDPDFHRARVDGHNIRFTLSDGKTLLKYEREYWIGGNGNPAIAHFWVKVPSILADGGATIYIYYGKPDAPDGEDAPNVWDANFKGVWHMKDITPSTIADSTGVNNGTKLAANEPIEADGKIYKGQLHDGEDERVNCGNDVSLEGGGGSVSVEAWICATSVIGNYKYIVAKGTSYGYGSYRMYRQGTAIGFYAGWDVGHDGSKQCDYNVGSAGLLNKKVHIVGAFEDIAPFNEYMYINGVLKKTLPTGAPRDPKPNFWLGIGGAGYVNRYFGGLIDEVRVSDIMRVPAWWKFGHHNINEADNEITWGAEEGIYYGPGFPIFEKKKRLLLIGERKPVFIGQRR